MIQEKENIRKDQYFIEENQGKRLHRENLLGPLATMRFGKLDTCAKLYPQGRPEGQWNLKANVKLQHHLKPHAHQHRTESHWQRDLNTTSNQTLSEQ